MYLFEIYLELLFLFKIGTLLLGYSTERSVGKSVRRSTIGNGLFYALVGSAVLAFTNYFLFDGPVDPMLIIPWIAFTSLFGYLGEELTVGLF